MPEKIKLTPDERREHVRAARESHVSDFFCPDGKTRIFDYVGPVTLDKGEKYTDITGNKGRSGFIVKDRMTGDETIIGPTALKKGVEKYQAIKGYKTKAELRQSASA